MLLNNLYKMVQSLIAKNDGDEYAKCKSYNGSEFTAYPGPLNSTMFEIANLLAKKQLSSYSYWFYALGSSDAPVTKDDFTVGALNADLTVEYLSDESNIIYDTENHKVTVTRAWSLTNTSTTLEVGVKEIGMFASYGALIWRELLGNKSFILQPLQAGKFTMTLEYNLLDYSSDAVTSIFNTDL